MTHLETELLDLAESLLMNDDTVHDVDYQTLYSIATDVGDVESENAGLRELVKNALTALDNNCAKCVYADGCTILKDCKCQAPNRLRDELCKLGIEVGA